MSCLLKYKWVKLQRGAIPNLPGVLPAYLRLTARAAFAAGKVRYCQHTNDIPAGGWAGGIVGLKSIMGVKSAEKALRTMDTLSDLNLITYSYNRENKLISYKINDHITDPEIKPEKENSIFAHAPESFIRIYRNLTNRLLHTDFVFEEGDAWLDLWCHTVSGDNINIFSFMAPCVQFERNHAAITLSNLAERWNWNKLKVQRFLAKNRNVFCLKKLPGSFGAVIFNLSHMDIAAPEEPSTDQLFSVCRFIKKKHKNTRFIQSDREQFCQLVLKYTKKCMASFYEKNRVSFPFIYAYCSPVSCRITVLHKGCGGVLENIIERKIKNKAFPGAQSILFTDPFLRATMEADPALLNALDDDLRPQPGESVPFTRKVSFKAWTPEDNAAYFYG